MHSYAPADYVCPICLGVAGKETPDTLIKQSDLVYKEDAASVFINSFYLPGNEGHAIVVPNQHIETLYDLPDETGASIMKLSKHIAVAMKSAYACHGITIQQNNEPAGGQHAFHYHLHVFPRYEDDSFGSYEKKLLSPDKRQHYAARLKAAL